MFSEFGPELAAIGPNFAQVGQHWSRFGRRWPKSASVWPKTANPGRGWTKTRLPEQRFDNFQTTVAQIWRNSVGDLLNLAPNRPKCSPKRPTLGRCSTPLATSRQLCSVWPTSDKVRPDTAKLGQLWAEHTSASCRQLRNSPRLPVEQPFGTPVEQRFGNFRVTFFSLSAIAGLSADAAIITPICAPPPCGGHTHPSPRQPPAPATGLDLLGGVLRPRERDVVRLPGCCGRRMRRGLAIPALPCAHLFAVVEGGAAVPPHRAPRAHEDAQREASQPTSHAQSLWRHC